MCVSVNTSRLHLVKRLEGSDQEHDRHVSELRVLNSLAKLVAVFPRHKDISQHKVRPYFFHFAFGNISVVHGDDIDTLVSKSEVNHFLNSDAVVGE